MKRELIIDKAILIVLSIFSAILAVGFIVALAVNIPHNKEKCRLKKNAITLLQKSTDGQVVIRGKEYRSFRTVIRSGLDIKLMRILRVTALGDSEEYGIEVCGVVFQHHAIGDTVNINELHINL